MGKGVGHRRFYGITALVHPPPPSPPPPPLPGAPPPRQSRGTGGMGKGVGHRRFYGITALVTPTLTLPHQGGGDPLVCSLYRHRVCMSIKHLADLIGRRALRRHP